MMVSAFMQSNHDSYVNANRTTGQEKIMGASRKVVIERADGGRKWGLLSLSTIHTNDKITHTAFLKDVTDEVHRREEMRVLSMVANGTDDPVIITGIDCAYKSTQEGYLKRRFRSAAIGF